jgi:hypothetical protein
MPKAFRKQTSFQGLPIIEYRLFFYCLSEQVLRLKMPHYALNCRYIGATSAAGLGDVPSSYRYYLGNLGFFWGIFRDITPIAAPQALGWDSRGFLALG